MVSNTFKKLNTKKIISETNTTANLFNLYNAAKYDAAQNVAISIIKEFPKNQIVWKVLAAIFLIKNNNKKALEANRQALELDPFDDEVLNNIALAQQRLGKFEESEQNFNKSILSNPNSAVRHYNLGITLNALGKISDAEISYKKAIDIQPEYPQALNNLGNILKKKGKFKEAKVAFKKAIDLDFNYAEAHNNLGATLLEQGKLCEAEASFNTAINLNTKYVRPINNLACTMFDNGRIIEGVNNYLNAILLDPNDKEAWNNIYFSLEILKFKEEYSKAFDILFNASKSELFNTRASLLSYKLNRGNSNEKQILKETINTISNNKNLIIKNPIILKTSVSSYNNLPNKTIALLHHGRSGTGLLHSLIDSHSEISTLPSIYFSEFFDGDNWNKIIGDGWNQMIDNFIQIYSVFFDSRSNRPVSSKGTGSTDSIGVKEGMTALGDNNDEFLLLDKKKFKKEMSNLISKYNYIDQLTFFKIIHISFEKLLNNKKNKQTIFYHIHNPDTYSKLNFLRAAPESKWIVMVRNPVNSCESWIYDHFNNNSYKNIVNRISTMLFDIDDAALIDKDAVGVRLEDLKKDPKATFNSLCRWMGVREEESLYNMTAQGKKWWGDLSHQQIPAFGSMPKIKPKTIFSDNDRFILNTLFYPFSAAFGYVKEDINKFKKDLQIISPMIDELFDFEKILIHKDKVDYKNFKKSGNFLYLRSKLKNRLNILNKFNNYPNLLKPLKVNVKN